MTRRNCDSSEGSVKDVFNNSNKANDRYTITEYGGKTLHVFIKVKLTFPLIITICCVVYYNYVSFLCFMWVFVECYALLVLFLFFLYRNEKLMNMRNNK